LAVVFTAILTLRHLSPFRLMLQTQMLW